jgi:branched-chain amino acid transport system substrate-binding protein
MANCRFSRIILTCIVLAGVVPVVLGFSRTTASKDNVITFGAALPLTGPLATEGEKHLHGYEIWKDTVNALGGIYVEGVPHKVDIKYYDYKSDTATAVKLVEKLITEDGIKFIFGPHGSGSAKACSAVTEKYRIPMIAPSASSVEVYTQGYKYIFGTFTPNESLTEPLAKLAAGLPNGPKTVAIIARNDLFPLAIGNCAKDSVTAQGMNVVYFEKYPIGATDLSPMLIQMKARNPEWVFATGYAQDLILIRKQMKELAINPKMITMIAGAAYKEFVDALGPDAENVTTAAWWHPATKYQGTDIWKTAANYVAQFEKKYGYTPDYVPASASTVGLVFQRAIEAAGVLDAQKVRDQIAKSDFVTFFGPIQFDAKGQSAALDPPIMQIQNGKHMAVYPPSIAEAKLVYPMPESKR